jgi:hypothetical protein
MVETTNARNGSSIDDEEVAQTQTMKFRRCRSIDIGQPLPVACTVAKACCVQVTGGSTSVRSLRELQRRRKGRRSKTQQRHSTRICLAKPLHQSCIPHIYRSLSSHSTVKSKRESFCTGRCSMSPTLRHPCRQPGQRIAGLILAKTAVSGLYFSCGGALLCKRPFTGRGKLHVMYARGSRVGDKIIRGYTNPGKHLQGHNHAPKQNIRVARTRIPLNVVQTASCPALNLAAPCRWKEAFARS